MALPGQLHPVTPKVGGGEHMSHGCLVQEFLEIGRQEIIGKCFVTTSWSQSEDKGDWKEEPRGENFTMTSWSH